MFVMWPKKSELKTGSFSVLTFRLMYGGQRQRMSTC